MFFLFNFYQPNYDYQSYARLMTADLYLKNRLEQQLLNLETAGKIAQSSGDTILIRR